MSRSIAAVLVAGMINVSFASAGEFQKPASAAKLAPQFDRYQLAAGSALLLELITSLDSSSASVGDQVEATLWSPVIQDGVELIPEGSRVIGSIVEVVRAEKGRPMPSITFAFSVVEHANTRDRATLPTRRIVIEAPAAAPVARGRGKAKPKLPEAAMAAGSRFVARTTDPLLIRIPR